MPDVSILIPAFRPDYFDACVASALAQTHREFEIVVSDDCPGDDIQRVLAKWDDPRIRYQRNPTPGRNFSNLENLLRLARGRYLKFLWDDDVLYPRSVQMLVHAVEQTGAKLAFHHRHFIDTTGRILAAPTVVPGGSVTRVPPETIFTRMIGRRSNWVGEPSNVLLEADALRAVGFAFEVEGRPIRYLNDVALLYNFARAGHTIAGVGEFGSAFRQHPGQGSNEIAPSFAAGVFEWELLARSARAAAVLSADDYLQSLSLVHDWYRLFRDRHPLLNRFLALEPGQSPQTALSEPFLRTLDLSYFEIDVLRMGPLSRSPVRADQSRIPGLTAASPAPCQAVTALQGA